MKRNWRLARKTIMRLVVNIPVIAGVLGFPVRFVLAQELPPLVPLTAPAGGGRNPFANAETQLGTVQANAQIGEATLETIIGSVIQGALSLVGVIFLVLAVYAGYKWMTAQGDSDKITKAKDTLTAAIIGLVITLAAYAISIFVITKITGAAV